MTVENEATSGAVPADATKTPAVVEQAEEGKKVQVEAIVEPKETPEEVEPEAKPEQKPKPELTPEQRERRGDQRRIDRLVRDRAMLQAEIDQLRRETAKPQTDEPPQLTEEEVEKRATERARVLASQEVERQALSNMVETTIAKGRKAYAKFDDMTAAVAEEIEGFADESGKLRPLTAAIFDSDKPHELIKHLSDNLEIAAELATLSPLRQIRRIAQLEVEMSKPVTPKPSSAPKPITPVKGGGASADFDSMDPKDPRWGPEFMKRQAARRRF